MPRFPNTAPAFFRSPAFRLTAAVRPAPGVAIPLCEGYRLGNYSRPNSRLCIPVLSASISRERLFEAFLRLLRPLGCTVDVVLESSHRGDKRRRELRRHHIDRPVLESYLCEYEHLLTNDGCTGVAVIAAHRPMEVQFDEHKLLICYARDLRPFRTELRSLGISRNDEIPLILDAHHLHFSHALAVDRFADFAFRLGVGAEADMVAG